MGNVDPPAPGNLADTIRALVAEVDAATEQLADEEAGADLEELAGLLRKVEADVQAAAAMAPSLEGLRSAVGHLREACDLIDDGMPADAVIFEMNAAKARMEASLAES